MSDDSNEKTREQVCINGGPNPKDIPTNNDISVASAFCLCVVCFMFYHSVTFSPCVKI